MRKRTSILAAFAAATLLIGAADDSYAQQRRAGVDGCAALSDAVYGEIVVSALFGSYRLPPEPGQGDALSCDHTAASVSSGFARAMAAMNVLVSWSVPDPQHATACVSRDIALCYPLAKPMMSNWALDPESVAETWQIVSAIVSRRMPTGTSSDISSFREYELRIDLSNALMQSQPMFSGWGGRR